MWRAGSISDAAHDGLPTDSTEVQAQTEEVCGRLFDEASDPNGVLDRAAAGLRVHEHVVYLRAGISNLSEGYASLDASRPWLCYWISHSLALLSPEPMDADLAAAVVGFIARCADPAGGGYCGGPWPGQLAHLAPTYAAVNTLVTIGTPAALASLDRAALRRFLLRMQQPDGSFAMHEDGEADVRGSYCAVSVAALTGMLDEEISAGAADWLLGCQTYEGGMGATPGEEAHGGYTFCGLAALVLLRSAGRLRLSPLVAWLTQRQMAHSGGFQGRTNKLVDSCYSFWQGGAFPLVQAVLAGRGELPPSTDLFHAPALLDYVLLCAQAPHGGMRDKPGKGRDYYHTCYALSGLAVAAAAHDLSGVPPHWVQRVGLVNPTFNVRNDKVEAAIAHFGALSLEPHARAEGRP